MATTVRTARPTDYAALRALFSEENRIHAALEPEHVQVTQDVLTREELDAFTTDPARSLWVCGVEGTLVGAVLLSLVKERAHRWQRARTYAYVEDLIVSAEARGQGVGRRLMYAAREWAHARGTKTLELHVWEANEQAIGVYQALGLTTIRRRMAWSIAGEGPSDGESRSVSSLHP